LHQVYFYSRVDDIQTYTGDLPHGLSFLDNRNAARAKLTAFEHTRHSYRTDTWDTGTYRLNVTYKEGGQGIDRLACLQLEAPIPRQTEVAWPALSAVIAALDKEIDAPEFVSLWNGALNRKLILEALNDGEVDLTQTYGATLDQVGGVLSSITLHRNRDSESAGWGGELPLGLNFEDSPEILFAKIKQQPVQQSDSALTGHGVWHFPNYTLHVLYSNFFNQLLRIKLISPGAWKSFEES
jgi:hypothetical protein